MMQNLSNALIITVIGMALVFVALLLLWLIMALVIKIKDPVETAPEAGEEDAPQAALQDTLPLPGTDRKRRAAAAAVAVALQLHTSSPTGLSTHGPDHLAGGWQTSIRATNLSRRSQLFGRKQRG